MLLAPIRRCRSKEWLHMEPGEPGKSSQGGLKASWKQISWSRAELVAGAEPALVSGYGLSPQVISCCDYHSKRDFISSLASFQTLPCFSWKHSVFTLAESLEGCCLFSQKPSKMCCLFDFLFFLLIQTGFLFQICNDPGSSLTNTPALYK